MEWVKLGGNDFRIAFSIVCLSIRPPKVLIRVAIAWISLIRDSIWSKEEKRMEFIFPIRSVSANVVLFSKQLSSVFQISPAVVQCRTLATTCGSREHENSWRTANSWELLTGYLLLNTESRLGVLCFWTRDYSGNDFWGGVSGFREKQKL